jgi:hypothetical protein
MPGRKFFESILISVIVISCTKAPLRPSGSQGIRPAGSGDLDQAVGDHTLTVSLADEKFQDLETSELSYVAQMGGRTERGSLNFENGQAEIILEKVPERGRLKIEFFEGEELQFIAERPELTLNALEDRFNLANCRIQPVNWNGQNHNGNCNWKITEIQ